MQPEVALQFLWYNFHEFSILLSDLLDLRGSRRCTDNTVIDLRLAELLKK